MPTIFFYGPKLDPDKKREMVKSFTQSASQATGIPESAFVVYLQDVDHDDVSVGGVLLSDKKKA